MPAPTALRSHFVALCALLLLPALGRAQMQSLLEPVMVPEAVDALVNTLELREEQVDALEDLIAVIEAERLAVETALIQKMMDIGNRAEENPSVHIMATEEMKDWMVERMETARRVDDTRAGMYEDLRLLLDEGQLERFEAACMRAERLIVVRNEWGSELSGFSADPLTVEAELEVRSLLGPERLEAYDEAMLAYDRAMAKRIAHFRGEQDEMVDLVRKSESFLALQTDRRFLDRMQGFIDDLFDTRRVHQNRARAIAGTLTEDLREMWEDEWQRQAYPAIHALTRGEHAINAARKIEELTPEEREAVERIAKRTARQLRVIRRDWAGALQDAEESMSVEDGMVSEQPQSQETIDEAMRVREVSLAAERAIHDAIREELHVLLPVPPDGQETEALRGAGGS